VCLLSRKSDFSFPRLARLVQLRSRFFLKQLQRAFFFGSAPMRESELNWALHTSGMLVASGHP
jgi:hypothetical protein